MRLAETEGKQRLVLMERDDWRFINAPYLAIQEALHRSRGLPPRSKEEVAAIHEPDWEADVGLASELIQFQRDALGE